MSGYVVWFGFMGAFSVGDNFEVAVFPDGKGGPLEQRQYGHAVPVEEAIIWALDRVPPDATGIGLSGIAARTLAGTLSAATRARITGKIYDPQVAYDGTQIGGVGDMTRFGDATGVRLARELHFAAVQAIKQQW